LISYDVISEPSLCGGVHRTVSCRSILSPVGEGSITTVGGAIRSGAVLGVMSSDSGLSLPQPSLLRARTVNV